MPCSAVRPPMMMMTTIMTFNKVENEKKGARIWLAGINPLSWRPRHCIVSRIHESTKTTIVTPLRIYHTPSCTNFVSFKLQEALSGGVHISQYLCCFVTWSEPSLVFSIGTVKASVYRGRQAIAKCLHNGDM